MWLVEFSKLSQDLGTCTYGFSVKCVFQKRKFHRTSRKLPSLAMKPASWSFHLSRSVRFQTHALECRYYPFSCNSFLTPSQRPHIPYIENVASTLTRSYNGLEVSNTVLKLIPAVGTIIFSVWGVGPLLRLCRNKSNSNWDKSGTYFIMTSYLQPLLLWTGAMLLCRELDSMMLPTEASQIIKQRLLYFVRSLSTVLALAYCLSCVIQQVQKLFMDTISPSDTRNVGFQCAGTALYAAVWVAAVSLLIELLGFSTKKLLTVGGLGTVLLTLACREVLTNFLSSVLIHLTRPFVVNDVIRTTIKGTEVSGAVEHVGWWSPTIIRGEYGEAVYVPNHQFTANIVRNLSHKSHWRIKTYLAISHLDFRKIKNIVADMRKVLAKNPLVEQKKLHRRVFLDNINPDNQALTILVSCFVKTSHTEEYLCVKEAILIDLLGVIRHHQARLATPIRTVQRVSDTELHNIPHVHPAGPTKPDHRDIFLDKDFKTTKQSNAHSKSPDVDNVMRNRKGKTKTSSDADPKSIYWPSIL